MKIFIKNNSIFFRHQKKFSSTSSLVILKKIGLLFEADNEKSISSIKVLLDYFFKKNIKLNVLGFVNKSKLESYHLSTLHLNYFNLKHLNWLGLPNSDLTDSFLLDDYDMVINLSIKDSFCNRYLSLRSKSKYKIGLFSKKCNFNYDLMLKLKIHSLDYFITHLIHYLELIDKNNEK